MKSLRAGFANPSAIYRGAPFWSWNDKLEIKELEHQVACLKEHGLGGFFMHSRVGLLTPYMGKEWMECIGATVNKAKETGVKAWLYDEDRWPSGFAGGVVPGGVKEHTSVELTYKNFTGGEKIKANEDVVAIFKWDGKNADSIGEKVEIDKAEGEKGPFIIFKLFWDGKNEWFNDQPYTNNLHQGAVSAFVKSTYEKYFEKFGNEFGNTIPGIFTDEPHYPAMAWGDAPRVPWLPGLEDIFKKDNGYNIIPMLPKLFFTLPGCEKARYHFWRTITRLFVTNYSKQIGEWCGKHNIWWTGHYLCEDFLATQIKFIGNAMRHYEWMQAPGVDHLCEHINYILTMKQVSSVANQLGKKRVLSELYGTNGWNFSFEGQKWIGDWEYALGVNLRCQHLALYTLRGCRKRDFPPSIFYQQPWWEHYNIVENYFGRLSLAMTTGKFQPEVLLIHPMNAAYLDYVPEKSELLEYLDTAFKRISTWLCELHRMYDYGDETIMERHGKITGKQIAIGEMRYKIVIIPPMKTLTKRAFNLLEKFAEKGGKIIALGQYPTMIDAEPSEELSRFIEKKCLRVALEKEMLEQTLDNALGDGVSVRDCLGKHIPDIYVHRRKMGKSEIFFLNNISREKSYDAVFSINAKGLVENWNLVEGAIDKIECETSQNRTTIQLHFEPVGSYLITVDTSKKSYRSPVKIKAKKEEVVAEISGQWKFRRLNPNILTLDYCRYKLGEDTSLKPMSPDGWSELMPVWKTQKQIRTHFGLRQIWHNGGVSFWKVEKLGLNNISKPEKVSLKFQYRTNMPDAKISLMLETPEIFDIFVNNQRVDFESIVMGTYIDPCFKVLDISGLSHKGLNEIVLSCMYQGQYELENIYLTGDFGVYPDGGLFILDEEPKMLNTGDWVQQGYPFYSGIMAYETKIKLNKEKGNYFIRFDRFKGIVLRVLINGKKAGILCWKPYCIDITGFLTSGINSISIEIVTSLRNTMGPHHHGAGNDIMFCAPDSFCDERRWTDSYSFVPYGITDPVRIVRL